jgi:hypothetical protein
MVTSNFFGFNNGYVRDTTILPGKAYWVKVDQACLLILSSSMLKNIVARIKIVPTSEQPPPPPNDDLTEERLPSVYVLEQCYPNPFNPVTIIKYQLPTDSKVTLIIYNLLGQVVNTLTDELQSGGYKSVQWDANNAASGIYFYRLETTSVADPSKSFTQVKKMILLK